MVCLVGMAQEQSRGTITDQALKRVSCRAIPEEFRLAINFITEKEVNMSEFHRQVEIEERHL